MPQFFTTRLGKDSVPDIRKLDAIHSQPSAPIKLTVRCTQVPKELKSGDYIFLLFGSDNDKGAKIDWSRGLRAFGIVTSRKGESGYNDSQAIGIDVGVVLPDTVRQQDFLAKAPAAYYWFSDVPVVGLNTFSNQTIQHIKPESPRQDVRALLYALNTVYPGFRAQLKSAYPELDALFNYTPPAPDLPTVSGDKADVQAEKSVQSDGKSLAIPEFLPAEWILALASKGLLLVTGVSGTGKSWTARDIARAMDYELDQKYAQTQTACRPANCLSMVGVDSGWTDGTPLLGFRNFFGFPHSVTIKDGQTQSSNEVWEPPKALRLLLRAADRPDQPHFLVLEEMNLSHVERYFSQFLWLLEANSGLDTASKFQLLDRDALQLISDTLAARDEHPLEREVALRLALAGSGLSIPDNVFIIGTVNVDETTYMFSPKVLDRAYVIEMMAPDPSDYLDGVPDPAESLVPVAQAKAILSEAAQRKRNGFWERQKPSEILQSAAKSGIFEPTLPEIFSAIRSTLNGLQRLMRPIGFAFAKRTMKEVCIYMGTYIECDDPALLADSAECQGWQVALDNAICQKVLPRLHGSRRQLGDGLRAIAEFLSGKAASYHIGFQKFEIGKDEVLGFSLPRSVAKLQTMQLKLDATGHTTFVE